MTEAIALRVFVLVPPRVRAKPPLAMPPRLLPKLSAPVLLLVKGAAALSRRLRFVSLKVWVLAALLTIPLAPRVNTSTAPPEVPVKVQPAVPKLNCRPSAVMLAESFGLKETDAAENWPNWAAVGTPRLQLPAVLKLVPTLLQTVWPRDACMPKPKTSAATKPRRGRAQAPFDPSALRVLRRMPLRWPPRSSTS